MGHRFRVKLCLIQPEKPGDDPFTLRMNPGAATKKKEKTGDIHSANASAVLCYSAAVKARRKMDVSLFADCEIGYIGEKTFRSFSAKHFAAHFHCIFCKHMYLFTFPQPHISIRCTAAGL